MNKQQIRMIHEELHYINLSLNCEFYGVEPKILSKFANLLGNITGQFMWVFFKNSVIIQDNFEQ